MKHTKQARRAAKQLFRLCFIEGLLDEDRVRQLVRRISETRNRNRFVILSHFQHLLRLHRVRHMATIESAVPLTLDLQTNVRTALLRAYGPELDATFRQEPALIGGMRIRVGSDVYDGSVRAKLAVLEEAFS